MRLTEFGIKLGPGQVVDLDFYCTRQQQEKSKELKRAISRRYVKVVNLQEVSPKHFHVGGVVSSPMRSAVRSLRKAIFLRTDIPVNPIYNFFVMRDFNSKLAIIKLATDVKLLNTIIRRETEARVSKAAHKKLQELVEHAS